MISLTKDNSCNHINVTSDNFDLSDISNLESITITSYIDCDQDTIYQNIYTAFEDLDCWYDVSIELASNEYDSLQSLTVLYNGGSEKEFVVNPTTYKIITSENLRSTEINTLQQEVNTWLSDNGYTGLFKVILEDGLETNSLVTFRFYGSLGDLEPKRVTVGNDSSSNNYQFADCSGADSSLNDDVDIENNTIKLTPAFYSSTESELSDGVYHVLLKIENIDNSVIEEEACIFIDCVTKCQVVDCIATSKNYEIHRIYESVVLAAECNNSGCDCADACANYEILKQALSNDCSENQQDDCGC